MLCRFCFSHRNFGCFDLVCLIVPSTSVIFPIGITVICNIICLWMGKLYAATPGQNPGVAHIYICVCVCYDEMFMTNAHWISFNYIDELSLIDDQWIFVNVLFVSPTNVDLSSSMDLAPKMRKQRGQKTCMFQTGREGLARYSIDIKWCHWPLGCI